MKYEISRIRGFVCFKVLPTTVKKNLKGIQDICVLIDRLEIKAEETSQLETLLDPNIFKNKITTLIIYSENAENITQQMLDNIIQINPRIVEIYLLSLNNLLRNHPKNMLDIKTVFSSLKWEKLLLRNANLIYNAFSLNLKNVYFKIWNSESNDNVFIKWTTLTLLLEVNNSDVSLISIYFSIYFANVIFIHI